MKEFKYPKAIHMSFWDKNSKEFVDYFAPTMFCNSKNKQVYFGGTTDGYKLKLFRVCNNDWNKARLNAFQFAKTEIIKANQGVVSCGLY